MHEGGFFYQAFIYLAAAVISVPIAKRLGLGSVLGYLIAGVAIGPFVLGLVGKEGQDVLHFAEFGVVMMLFLIGLELQPSLLWNLRASILGMGGIQVILTTSLIFGVSIALGMHWKTGLAIGLTLALSSTAIVLQTLNENGLIKTQGGQNAFSVLLFQDIAVIPILAVLPLLAIPEFLSSSTQIDPNHSTSWIDQLSIWAQTGLVIGIIVLIIVAGRYLIGPIFRQIAKTGLRELFTAAALLLIVGIALLMSYVGVSPALGTFIAGVVLAQSEYRHELETDIEPFKGLLLGLFFIAVGASIDFNLIFDQPLLIIELVGALILIKIFVLLLIGKIFKTNLDNNLLFAFALAQGSEFAFVLSSYALQTAVFSDYLTNIVISVVTISMVFTPLLLLANDLLIRPFFGVREKEIVKSDTISQKNKTIIAGFGRFGSTIGRFLQANGESATYLDINPDNVALLRKLGLKVFYGDASRHDLLHAAGAAEAELLIVAVDEPEKTRAIIETANKHFPKLRIFTRTIGWNDSYEVLDMGIKNVYRETLDSALRLGADALCFLGHRRFQTHRALKSFRRNDDRYLQELSEMRHDNKQYILGARRRIEDLEELLKTELNRVGKDKDLGWDASSLIEEYGDNKKN